MMGTIRFPFYKNSIPISMLFLLFALCSFSIQAEEKRQVLTFGVVPQQSASTLAELWTPLLAEWSRLSGYDIQFETAPDIPSFEKRLSEGRYDLAYMNPFHFTLYSRIPGYDAIGHAKDKKITGIIVTHVDWQGDLQSLNGLQIAFPAPRAFAATVLTQSEMSAQHITFSPRYVGSHDSVYLAVSKGLFAGGGGIVRTFNSLPPQIKNKLKIIHHTDRYTPHAIAIHPEMDDDKAHILQKTLIELNGADTLSNIFSALNIKGFQFAENSDWDDVVALGINR